MQFLYSNVLFLMLIPALLLMFLIITNKDKFQEYFSKEALSKLSVKNKYMNKTTRNVLFFISLLLMILALARPVTNQKEISIKQSVASIAIAIDVSKSMLANDIYPNRLDFAKRKLLNIIDLSKKNALAVILFAKNSYILSPVTQDFNSLKILVNNFDTGTNFDNGSNIFSTLETSNKLLKDYENKNLILLTDGGNKSNFSDEIKYANEHKINVYTIALGNDKASPIRLNNGSFMTKKDGSIVTVKLNEAIKTLSLKTHGGYIKYTISNDDIKQIIQDINRKSKKKELESRKYKTYTELFYYPLGLAIFILLIAFSSMPKLLSKKILTLFIVLFIFYNQENLQAFEFDFQNIKKGQNYYKKGEYKKAQSEYEKINKTPQARYNLGNSLYKQGKYKKALKAYSNVTTSNKDLELKKLYNMGNSYVKLNDLKNAKKMYENALKIKNDKETKENLEKVLEALKKKRKQNKQNKNQNKKKQENSKKQNNKDNKNKQNEKKNQKQENKKNKNNEQNNTNKKHQNSKKQDLKNQKKQQKENFNKNSSKLKKQEISNKEEKKWLNKLENNKTPILLKRVETKHQDDSSTPW